MRGEPAPASRSASRRLTERRTARGWWGLWILRLFYVGYGLAYALKVLDGAPDALAGPELAAYLFTPTVTLVVVALALLRLTREPFVWAVTLAGLQTLHAINAQHHGTSSAFVVGATAGLWIVALVAPRIERGLAGLGLDPKFAADDRRVVAAVLWIYLGIVAALLVFVNLPFLGFWAYYPAMVLVGTIALRILGGWWRDVMPLGIGPRAAIWGLAAGAAYAAVAWVYAAWSGGSWTPSGWALAAVPGGLFFWHALLPGVVEEALCRGVLWQAVRERACRGGAIVATSVLFALLHLVLDDDLPGLPIQFVAGLLLGVVRVQTASVGACILSHMVANTLLVSLALGAS